MEQSQQQESLKKRGRPKKIKVKDSNIHITTYPEIKMLFKKKAKDANMSCAVFFEYLINQKTNSTHTQP